MLKERKEQKIREIRDRLNYLNRYIPSISPKVSIYAGLVSERKKLRRDLAFMKLKKETVL